MAKCATSLANASLASFSTYFWYFIPNRVFHRCNDSNHLIIIIIIDFLLNAPSPTPFTAPITGAPIFHRFLVSPSRALLKSTMATQSKLLELPLELRHIIYEFAFGPATPIHLYQRGHSSVTNSPVRFCIALLLVCKQVHEEGTAILYQHRLGMCSPFSFLQSPKMRFFGLLKCFVLRDKTCPTRGVLILVCSRYCGWFSTLLIISTKQSLCRNAAKHGRGPSSPQFHQQA